MKKSIAVAIVVVLGAGIYIQRGPLSMWVMSRMLPELLSSSVLDSLEDGLHVALCGAGGPLPAPKRSGACVAVVAGNKLFVVDAGNYGARNMNRMRYPMGAIEALFLTHFHSDHIDGLGELAMQRWVNAANRKPLPVHGPEGVEKVVEGFNAAYALDAIYRHEHHGDIVAPLSGTGMLAHPHTAPLMGESITVYESDDLTVQMLTVDHDPVSPAVAYLFSYKGRTVLISGDTAKSDNLQHFAKGVDLLVHEALSPELVGLMNRAASESGNTIMAKITHDILNYHASPVDAAEIARHAKVGHLLYYHIVPPLILPGTEAAWLTGVDEVFRNYTVGIDGTAFSLPAGSTEIAKLENTIY
jgi:ribonuclease Z